MNEEEMKELTNEECEELINENQDMVEEELRNMFADNLIRKGVTINSLRQIKIGTWDVAASSPYVLFNIEEGIYKNMEFNFDMNWQQMDYDLQSVKFITVDGYTFHEYLKEQKQEYRKISETLENWDYDAGSVDEKYQLEERQNEMFEEELEKFKTEIMTIIIEAYEEINLYDFYEKLYEHFNKLMNE